MLYKGAIWILFLFFSFLIRDELISQFKYSNSDLCEVLCRYRMPFKQQVEEQSERIRCLTAERDSLKIEVNQSKVPTASFLHLIFCSIFLNKSNNLLTHTKCTAVKLLKGRLLRTSAAMGGGGWLMWTRRELWSDCMRTSATLLGTKAWWQRLLPVVCNVFD